MEKLKKEELQKLQEKSLDLAVYFVEFCKKNKLLCYLWRRMHWNDTA